MSERLSKQPIALMSAAVASALGFEWRGLAQAMASNTIELKPAESLLRSHPGTAAAEVPAIPKELDAGDVRVHRQMSRAARLAAVCVRRALTEACFDPPRDDIGYFLGVGASGGAVSDLLAVLRESLDGRRVSMAKFGEAGLLATNPVSTFQLLNNFTLCHGAILEGTRGPNGAFFSRGGGTVLALQEALAALLEGDCARVLAGGADTALHPVTWAELVREGVANDGFVPGEGAGIFALQVGEHADAMAYVRHCSVHFIGRPGNLREPDEDCLGDRLRGLRAQMGDVDWIVLSPWGGGARVALQSILPSIFSSSNRWDITKILGDSLAAGPALAWAAALDALHSERAGRALVVNAGIDGHLGMVLLSREPCACSRRLL